MTPDGAAHPERTGAPDAPRAGQRVVAVVPLRDGSSGKSRLSAVLDPAERSRLIAALARHVVGTLLASEVVERVLVVTSDPRFTWRAVGGLVAPVPPPRDETPTVTDLPADGDGPRADGDVSNAEGDGPSRLQIVLQPASRPGLNAALDVGRALVADAAADHAGGGDHGTGHGTAHRTAHGATSDTTDAATSAATASTATRPVRLLVAHADLPALTVEDVEALLAEEAPVVVATDRARSGTNLLVLDADAPFTFSFGVGSLDAHLAEAGRQGVRAAVVQRAGTAVDLDTLDDWAELPADVRARPELADLHRAMDRARSDT